MVQNQVSSLVVAVSQFLGALITRLGLCLFYPNTCDIGQMQDQTCSGEDLTVVEGLRSITEEHSSDCQQAANGDAETVELSCGQGTQGKEENDNLKNSPASNATPC